MLRRSFRVGLTLGVLAGVAAAVLKMVQGRREAAVDSGARDRWQPPPPRPPQPAPPERTEVVRSPVQRPADVPHSAPAAKEDVRPRTPRPDDNVQAAPVPAPDDVPHSPAPPAPPAARPPAPEPAAPPAPPPPAKRAAKKAAKRTRKTSAKRAAQQAAQQAAKKAAKQAAPAAAWVEPSGGTCPPSHPIKGKLSSKIFHAPGQLNYDRTAPDRCYRDEGAAEGDGLRPAKR